MERESVNLNYCLQKMVDAFKDISQVEYTINRIIKPYREYAQQNPTDDVYRENSLIVTKKVFSMRCICGLCHFTLGYNLSEETPIYEMTFENLDTKQSLFISSLDEYNSAKISQINEKIYEITD